MKSTVKIGRHCPSRIIAKITGCSVQVEFVPTHIGHDCEIAKIPLSQKKRHDIACRLASNNSNSTTNNIHGTGSSNTNQLGQQQTVSGNGKHIAITGTSSTSTSSTSATGTAALTSHQHNHTDHYQQQHQGNSTTALAPQQHNPIEQQASGSTLIRNDTSIMSNLGAMKTTLAQDPQSGTTNTLQRLVAPTNSQQMIANPQQASTSGQTQQEQQQLATATNSLSSNGNMALQQHIHMTTPNRQELIHRFEQLLLSIRSDKHASIVKAQLEVCFALIRD